MKAEIFTIFASGRFRWYGPFISDDARGRGKSFDFPEKISIWMILQPFRQVMRAFWKADLFRFQLGFLFNIVQKTPTSTLKFQGKYSTHLMSE